MVGTAFWGRKSWVALALVLGCSGAPQSGVEIRPVPEENVCKTHLPRVMAEIRGIPRTDSRRAPAIEKASELFNILCR